MISILALLFILPVQAAEPGDCLITRQSNKKQVAEYKKKVPQAACKTECDEWIATSLYWDALCTWNGKTLRQHKSKACFMTAKLNGKPDIIAIGNDMKRDACLAECRKGLGGSPAESCLWNDQDLPLK